MIKFKDTDFLYSSSRVRYLENSLLSMSDLKKMVEAKTPDEAFHIAKDKAIDTDKTTDDYEVGLSESLNKSFALVEEMSPDKELIDIFRYKYDGHNLKVCVKATKLDAIDTVELSTLGTVPPAKVLDAFKSKDFRLFPQPLAESAAEAIEVLAKTGNPQLVDIIIDRAVMASMSSKAANYDVKFLHDIVAAQIDISNIRALVRIKRMGKDTSFLKTALIEGGTLEVSRLVSVFSKSYDDIWAVFSSLPYGKYLEDALTSIKEGGRLTVFEKLCDDYLYHVVRSSRLVPFGIEPLISYLIAKETEVQAVRIVIASKKGGVAPHLITERLRETYA